MASEGMVKTLEQNPDGSVKKQSDGSVNWVRQDGLKLIAVNGHPGVGSEPNKVNVGGSGEVVNNPGTLDWYANGSEYEIWGSTCPYPSS